MFPSIQTSGFFGYLRNSHSQTKLMDTLQGLIEGLREDSIQVPAINRRLRCGLSYSCVHLKSRSRAVEGRSNDELLVPAQVVCHIRRFHDE